MLEYSNAFLKDRFHIVLESKHIQDDGTSHNVFNLSEDELEQRKIVWIDIAGDVVPDNHPSLEPSTFQSVKTGRGKLKGEWWKECKPVMCAYKLVTIKFQVFGLQTRIETTILNKQKELMTKFHKEVFCSIDKWFGLTMDDIRMLEDQVKKELDAKMKEFGLDAGKDLDSSESIKSSPY